jgi:myosin heavy subunit
MSKDIKDLIEKAEEEQETRAHLEKTIEQLKTEVATLKIKLEEKKFSYKIEPVRHVEEPKDTEDIIILKDMISSLKQELQQKTDEKESLHEMVEELSLELESTREKLADPKKDEILSRTQNSLNSLIKDYSRLENENKILKSQMAELKSEIEEQSHSFSTTKIQVNETLNLEIKDLKQKIMILEKTNNSLIADLNALKIKKHSAEEIESIIKNLQENNLELERENKALEEKLEILKREKLRIFKYENQIADMTKKIEELEGKNRELRERDSILLAKTITALNSQNKQEKKIFDAKKGIEPNLNPLKTDQQEKIVSELNVSRPNGLANKTQRITPEFVEKKPFKMPPPISNVQLDTEKLSNEQITTKPQVEIKKTPRSELELPPHIQEETPDSDASRKWQCPKCGNTNKTQIRESDDKTRLIYSYPRIYAKKYTCGHCGAEWR